MHCAIGWGLWEWRDGTVSPGVRTIITAAGDSRSLFLPAGFGAPKSLVRTAGREVLRHAIESYAVDKSRTTVAVNSAEDDDWAVGTALFSWYPEIKVVRVPCGTQGALASALFSLAGSEGGGPLVVAAGDSAISGGIARYVEGFMKRDLEAATVAFPSTNPRWSYLSVDENSNVIEVAEKKVIGPWATTGAFYFKSSETFLEAAQWCLVNNAHFNGRFYVSATLNYLVSVGRPVGFEVIQRDHYRSWSLPVDFAEGAI